MNRKNVQERFDFARRYDPALTETKVQVFKVDGKEVSAKDAILSEIYAPDPRSGLPTGDLAYFVSDKANPEVKRFILENVMMDTSSAAAPAAPKGMSDTDILALSRNSNESPQDYMQRLNLEIDNFKRINDELSKYSVSQNSVQQSFVE